jgi:hypothetical protein
MTDHTAATGLAAILLATLAIIVGAILTQAPRCTGPTQADRCPLAGGFNTSVNAYGGKK